VFCDLYFIVFNYVCVFVGRYTKYTEMHGLCNVEFPIENPMTVCPVTPALFYVDRRTDTRKLTVSYDNEVNAPKDTAPCRNTSVL
jgi:hypothetical protein